MHATNENAYPPRPLLMRVFVRSWEYPHRRLLWRLRCAVAVVYFGFSIVLFAYGSWWGLLSLAGAATAFFGGYLMYRSTQSQPAVRGA
jgi:hypothetical protein